MTFRWNSIRTVERRVLTLASLLCVSLGFAAGQEARPDGRVPEFLIVDLAGNGLCLTSRTAGVPLLFNGREARRLTPWTCPGSDDAFLVVDQNGNGSIDGAFEMLGGLLGPPDGFEYLRARAATRGIPWPHAWLEAGHRLFDQLALWADRDHNGRSEWKELQSLAYAGVLRLELTGRSDGSRDRWGNLFLARSRLQLTRDGTTATTFVTSVRLAAWHP